MNKSVAQALDIIQGEESCSIAVPILTMVLNSLKANRSDEDLLIFCKLLDDSVQKRFENVLSNEFYRC